MIRCLIGDFFLPGRCAFAATDKGVQRVPPRTAAPATAAGGVFALLTPILVGWLSDRTVTRWGRRRPWMVAGTILNIVGLGLLALSSSQLTFIGAYLVVQLSNNAAGAAYTGVIPDVVRAEDRGRASGLLGTMN